MRFWMRLFLSVFLVFGLSFAGISVSNYTVSKSTYQPGDIGIITITVTNPTGADRVSGLTMTIYNPSELTISSSPKLADIESGGTAIVSIPFKVASDADPGIYLFNVQFGGISGSDVITNTISVPVTVADLPIIEISADSKLISGVDSVGLTVNNSGGPASDFRMGVSNLSGVALYGTNQVYLGDLKKFKTLNLTLDARSAADGPVDLPVVLTYYDEIGALHSETVFLRLTVKKEKLDMRFNQLSNLTTREEGTLRLEVVNNGEDISDVRLSFTDPDFRLKDASEIKIGDMESNEKTTISSLVYPTLSPGLNLVDAKITYRERGVSKSETLTIPVTITSDSDVAVYLESKPSPLVSGTEHTISVLVSNLGSYQIDNVDVGLDSKAFTLLDITPRQYIGSLAEDDFSTVQFRVMTNGVSGDFPVDVNVRYRDASGEWINKTITQNAKITSVQTTGDGTLTFLGVIIVVAAVLVWYFKLRKKG